MPSGRRVIAGFPDGPAAETRPQVVSAAGEKLYFAVPRQGSQAGRREKSASQTGDAPDRCIFLFACMAEKETVNPAWARSRRSRRPYALSLFRLVLQKADSKCHSSKYTKENIRFAAKKLTGPTEPEIISSIYLQTVRMICRQFNMAAFRAHIARHCTSLFTFKNALLLVYKLYFDILRPYHFCLEHFSITSVTLHSRVLLKF